MTPDVAPAERLARAVRRTRWHELPEAARASAAALFLDTLAVIAAGGADAAFGRWARALARDAGPCLAIPARRRVSARSAALINGAATTVHQWQDGHRRARGHPASHLVPALLACAERRDNDGPSVLGAFVGGYECAVRLGLALGRLAPTLHDAGTWPTPAAAAASAALLGGSDAEVAAALAGAACIVPQPYRETARGGHAVHHLYIGLGAASAVLAAESACAGVDAPTDAVERFFGVRLAEDFDVAALTADLTSDDRWQRYEIVNAYLKWNPVCAHFSGAAELVEGLRDECGALDVQRVDVGLCAAALEYHNAEPANDLAARFSVPAIVRAALADTGLWGTVANGFATACGGEPRSVFEVRVVHDRTLDAGYPAGRPTTVTVHLRSGTALTRSITDVYGDTARPLRDDDRRRKTLFALERALGANGARRTCDAYDAFVAGGSVSALAVALSGER